MVKDEVSEAFMAVWEKVANTTKRKVSIIGLELKHALKRVSTQIEMWSQATILHIREELERNDRKSFRNVAICLPVSHNRVAKAPRSLLRRPMQ